MKHRYVFLLFLGAFFLQSTVLIHFRVLGVTPNLVLCLVILLSFLYEGFQGAAFGMLFGLMQDVCFGQLIGVSCMGYFLVAMGILLIKHLLYRDNILSILVITVLGTTLFYFVYWSTLFVFKSHYHFLYMLKMLPIQAIWNCVITTIYYIILGKRLEKNPRDRYVR